MALRSPAITLLVWAFFDAQSALAQPNDLAALYKNEIQLLSFERASLKKAIETFTATQQEAAAALEKDVDKLSAELTRLRTQNSLENQRLSSIERASSGEEQGEQIQALSRQILGWAKLHHFKVRQEHPPIQELLAEVSQHIHHQGKLRVEHNQGYFDSDGLARFGSVLKLGGVSALHLDEKTRPLILLDNGALGVAPGFEPETVKLTQGRRSGVVLFDPDDLSGAAFLHSDTAYDWLRKGGALMWPIAALALVAFLLFMERALKLSIESWRCFRYRSLAQREMKVEPSRLLAKESSPLFFPLQALLSSSAERPADLEEKVTQALLASQPTLVRGVSLLGIVASVAPLLGLLGTVTGMIGTFSVITEHGTGDPRLLSEGISQALLTTQFGLMVAVPALLANTILHRWANMVLAAIEDMGVNLIRLREKQALPTINAAASESKAEGREATRD